MIVEADLPEWIVDAVARRAEALAVGWNEALVRSLEIGHDRQAAALGWAVAQGERPEVVALRSHYSRSTVEQAHQRYRRYRSNAD
jgi:hypothetical protein